MTNARIEPMPEELAIAHQGRVAHFIGVQNEQEFNKWLRGKIASEAPESAQLSRLNQLAIVSGMSTTEYARLHSLLGLMRFAARSDSLGNHGDLGGERFSRRMGMGNQKGAAYLCTQCVKEDLEHWRFTWYRRSHHILGIDCCPVHQIPLAKVQSVDPWMKLPQHWVESTRIH